MARLAERRALRHARGYLPPPPDLPPLPIVFDLMELLLAVERVIAAIPSPVLHRVITRPLDVEGAVRRIEALLAEHGRIRLAGDLRKPGRRSWTCCPHCWRCSNWPGAASAACARTLLSLRWWSPVSSLNPLSQLIEAALFAANRPLTLDELEALDPDAGAADVRTALEQLREHYDFDGHAVEVVELAGGYQILTRAVIRRGGRAGPGDAAPAASSRRRRSRRSPTIAYRQPVGRAEIEEIRGVNSGGVLRTLQERGLIEVVGRGEALGRPLLYGTTALFLETLGLNDLADLPRAEELTIALQPHRADRRWR